MADGVRSLDDSWGPSAGNPRGTGDWSRSAADWEPGVDVPGVKIESEWTNGDLRRQTIIGDRSAEDRGRDEMPCLRRWLRQLRIRVGDPMNRLRRPGPFVIAHVFSYDPANVIALRKMK